jgi:16S rRNA (cytosine1402-N4)-methyltransferase
MQPDSFYHQSVLLQESITQLNIQPQGTYLDATFGGGGHSKAILEKLGPTGKLIVFDQDADAQRNLPDDPRLIFIPENFRYAARFVRMHKLGLLNGVLADLGVSSFQFDTPERGFSIRFDAALDMRMDQRQKITAADVLNTYSEKNLIALFENYGEITNAKLLVKRILEYKNSASLQTIQAFKQLIAPVQYGNPNKYLAQVFQALRIEVNDELGALKEFLETMTPCLAPSGRMVVITFHSLEDRLVKQWMKEESFGTPLPFENKKKRSLQVISKKPILPGIDEEKSNPRARSAKLRVAERIP